MDVCAHIDIILSVRAFSHLCIYKLIQNYMYSIGYRGERFSIASVA